MVVWLCVNSVGYSFQFMGLAPCAINRSLHLLNGFEPKNPLEADNGDGCGEAIIGVFPKYCVAVCACFPHSIATNGLLRSTSFCIANCVISSQPLPVCDPANEVCTLSVLFSNITP